MTNMGDGKERPVTDGDAVGGVDRMGGVEVTGVRRHVSGGATVHVPIAAAGVAGRGRGGVESRQKGQVPRCRREGRRSRQGRLLPVGRCIGLRRGVVRLV